MKTTKIYEIDMEAPGGGCKRVRLISINGYGSSPNQEDEYAVEEDCSDLLGDPSWRIIKRWRVGSPRFRTMGILVRMIKTLTAALNRRG